MLMILSVESALMQELILSGIAILKLLLICKQPWNQVPCRL